MVFQSYAVWPHMSVFENVAYPLRAMGAPRASIKPRVDDALRLVQLDHLGERYSSQLSGGQQQRVALARSLVSEPKLLLFDEPLSNLDANLRLQMRIEIKQLQKKLGFTGVYVTHDQAEALAIADRVAIMRGGLLQQIGTPREVYDWPANAFVAGFMGVANILPCAASRNADGSVDVQVRDGGVLRGVSADDPLDARTKISIRPEAIRLAQAGHAPPGPNVWPAQVVLTTFVGETIIYHVKSGAHTLEARQPSNVAFDPGTEIVIIIDPTRCRLLNE
jgi:iron(III) transport system ATP-binding protein